MKKTAATAPSFTGISLFSGILGLVSVVVALLALSLISEYRDANQNAHEAVVNTSRLLEENVLAIVQKSDLLLREIQRNVRPGDMRQPLGKATLRQKELHALLKSLRTSVAEVDVIHITNTKGDHLYSSLDPVPPINIGDRYHFMRHQREADAGLVISPPLVSRTTEKWTLVLSRRLNFEDGSFAGVINIVLNLGYFQKFYNSLSLGQRGLVALYDTDFHLAARYPSREKDLGRKVPGIAAETMLKQGINHGEFADFSPLDGIERMFSFRQVSDLPLVVFSGIAKEDYLGEWKRHLWHACIGIVVFILVVATFGLRQRRAQEDLRAASLYGRSLIEASLDPLVTIGADGKIMDVNSATENVTGRLRDQLIGSDFADYFTDPEQAQRSYQEVFLHGQVTDYPLAICHTSGKITDVLYNASIYRDAHGNVAGVFASARDITERKLAEQELKRSNAELEQFAYAISHDMRQPLRMVSSYLQLIEKTLRSQLDADTRQYLAFAKDGAQRMDGMILALLDFSRVGRKTEPMTQLDTRTAVDEALAFLGPELSTSGGTVNVSGDWPSLVVSRDELVRLFQNLIGNALKYHEEGKPPQVEVHSHLLEKAWRCEVRDQGIGIDITQVDRLFKVFSRLQARNQYDGAGVGLALCRKIVEHHGGSIGAESAGEGKGSTFWFELPLSTSPEHSESSPA